VGLLTRRSVDRAISHNLNLTAGSLMEAGQVFIHPEDSLETLQRLMTDTGWGQIPVVSEDDDQIIGIVTRTDLLKTLQQSPNLPSRQKLADRLELALPPARMMLLRTAAEAARQQRAALYIVGGFVRDLLLDRPSLDFDLVVEGDAIQLVKELSRRYGGRVTTHARFGTAKWFTAEIRQDLCRALEDASEKNATLLQSGIPPAGRFQAEDIPETLDFITARTEFYTHPTALPTVERGSIKLDLHRRDFTINTLAMRLDGHHYGELHDYWGGLNDLRQGIVRCLHSLSFVDDPTRMLRAVRFEQRFGFDIEGRTLQLLREALSLIDRVSGDRIRHELDHIFGEEQVCAMMRRLDELGLLDSIHPNLAWDGWMEERIELLMKVDLEKEWEQWKEPGTAEYQGVPDLLRRQLSYLLWLVRLTEERAKDVIARLKFARNMAENILEACALLRDLPQQVSRKPSETATRLDEAPPLALFAVYLVAESEQEREILMQYAQKWKFTVPAATGYELMRRGVPRGPEYRTILTRLRAAWLDGEISSIEEENALLEEILSKKQ
jgi:tRNA nucleotidyltransferase (CCA-adding enzyme)